jgi:hypothetical protein
MQLQSYKKLLLENDFEYFFKFKKTDTNFEDLWRMKSTARESLREWLLAIHTSPHLSEVISNSASELIENCIKYSHEETLSFVLIRVDGRIVTIETVNQSEPEELASVREFIRAIHLGEKTPAEMYVEKISESLQSGKSQLGLLRILMETEGTLELVEDAEQEKEVHLLVTIKVGTKT